MFATIGRFDDRGTLNRHLLAGLVLLSSAWTGLWLVIWAWVVLQLDALLQALLAMLFTLLFPNVFVPRMPQIVEPPVVVDLPDRPVPIPSTLADAADPPPLDAEDLSDASAEWEARQHAAKAARERARRARKALPVEQVDPAALLALTDEGDSQDVLEGEGVEGGMVGGVVGGVLDETPPDRNALIGAGSRGSGIGGGVAGGGVGRIVALDAPRHPVHLTLDVRDVQGGPDSETVRRILARHTTSVRACVDPAGPSTNGAFTATIEAGRDGHVVHVAASAGTLSDPNVIRCARHVLQGLTLPSPSEGTKVVVDVRFVFRS